MTTSFRTGWMAVWAVGLAGLGTSLALAQEPPPHLIYAVKTELHQELAPARANLLVFLDATTVLKDDRVLLEPLKLQELRKALLKHKKDGVKLHFTFFCRGGERDPLRQQEVLRYALIGFGHELGFSKATASGRHPNSDLTWADYIDEFTSKPRQPEGDEKSNANDLVKVFPVRTELSRCLTSDADCALVIVPGLKEEKNGLPEKVREAAITAMVGVNLAHKKKIAFYLGHVLEAELRQQLLKDLNKLAQRLGFESNSVTFR